MDESFESKKHIIESYFNDIGLSHEKQKISNTKDSHQWLFRFKDSSVFFMLFDENDQNYLWIEVAIFKEDHFSKNLTLFMLKTQYSYLHPYRLAISDKGFIVIQFITPLQKLCDRDFRLLLQDLLHFSEYVREELNSNFKLNSLSFEEES